MVKFIIFTLSVFMSTCANAGDNKGAVGDGGYRVETTSEVNNVADTKTVGSNADNGANVETNIKEIDMKANDGSNGKSVLVAYFSATGTTARVAEKIAVATKGQLYEIVPEKPYSQADLNWQNSRSRSSVEMNDPKARPSIKSGENVDTEHYDVIFIGYPIWWDMAPRVVYTFIESHNLKGKKLIPFATSGSSSIQGSVASLRKEYPSLEWSDGRLLNNASDESVRRFVDDCLK